MFSKAPEGWRTPKAGAKFDSAIVKVRMFVARTRQTATETVALPEKWFDESATSKLIHHRGEAQAARADP
jgi:hypothetical protein